MSRHTKPESERYKGASKWIQYILFRAFFSVLQRIPVRLAYRIGRGIGWIFWKTMRERRAVVKCNLTVVNDWSKDQQLDQLKGAIYDQVKEVFQRSGASLFSGFAFTKMTVKQMQGCVNIEGLDLLKSVLAENKGAIILLAHMGPWEALTQLPGLGKLQGIDAPFGVMYRPLNNHYLEQWYRGAREGKGTHLFSRRDGFHKPVDFLRSGGMLGILADQKMRQGVTVPYFGREVSTNPVPGLFHKRSGAPIIGLALTTVGDAQWKIKICPVDLPSDSSAADRATLAIACNEGLERIVSESVLDGFWFHNRF